MLLLYRGATATLGSLAGFWLNARAQQGKEDPARIDERFGRSSTPRPAGTLVWLHGASVGESGVALQLIEALAAKRPDLSFLVTTGTRTSADLVARRANSRTRHVYAPLDRADAVRRFLEHWRPDVGVFVESELWPNLILGAERACAPLALVNARMSPSSLRRMRKWRAASQRLLAAFRYISAADARTGEALGAILGRTVPSLGNLKLAADAPGADEHALSALKAEIGERPVWLAASTHQGEDEIVLAAHELLRRARPDALLIIAPRHPERGAAVAELARNAPRRSQRDAIGAASVYIADTLGELGLFYRLSPVAFVAGSLLPSLKGHNPVEPAKLGAAVLSGPYVESFSDLFAALTDAGAVTLVETAGALAAAVEFAWSNENARRKQCEAALGVVSRGASALEETVEAIVSLAPVRRAHETA